MDELVESPLVEYEHQPGNDQILDRSEGKGRIGRFDRLGYVSWNDLVMPVPCSRIENECQRVYLQ